MYIYIYINMGYNFRTNFKQFLFPSQPEACPSSSECCGLPIGLSCSAVTFGKSAPCEVSSRRAMMGNSFLHLFQRRKPSP